jgi:hypothetical protein
MRVALRVFMENSKKNSEKYKKKSVNFFVFRDSTSNLGSACENLGGLGSLVWHEYFLETFYLKLT